MHSPTPAPLDSSPVSAQKIAALHETIDSLKRVAVAFSAGIDSTLVLKVCAERLGENALAVIGISPSLPPGELEQARSLAKEIGTTLLEVETNELENPAYAANPDNRCYFCKKELFREVLPIARARKIPWVVDGLNADDLTDHRPGRVATDEAGVRHPLVEAGFHKSEVRDYARVLGLPNWNKPALACLSSRVPSGDPIDAELLQRIGQAESSLQALGFRGFRVRCHGELARLELPPPQLGRALEQREQISRSLRQLGFRFVTLDLEGYRRGSLNPSEAS